LSFLNQGQGKQHLCTPSQQHLYRTLSPKIVRPGNLKVVHVTAHLRQKKEGKQKKIGVGLAAVMMYILEIIFQKVFLMREFARDILVAREFL
jgi:hypothetical protein